MAVKTGRGSRKPVGDDGRSLLAERKWLVFNTERAKERDNFEFYMELSPQERHVLLHTMLEATRNERGWRPQTTPEPTHTVGRRQSPVDDFEM